MPSPRHGRFSYCRWGGGSEDTLSLHPCHLHRRAGGESQQVRTQTGGTAGSKAQPWSGAGDRVLNTPELPVCVHCTSLSKGLLAVGPRRRATPTAPSRRDDISEVKGAVWCLVQGGHKCHFPCPLKTCIPLLHSTEEKPFLSFALIGTKPIFAINTIKRGTNSFPLAATPTSQGRCGSHPSPFRRGGSPRRAPLVLQKVKINALQ